MRKRQLKFNASKQRVMPEYYPYHCCPFPAVAAKVPHRIDWRHDMIDRKSELSCFRLHH